MSSSSSNLLMFADLGDEHRTRGGAHAGDRLQAPGQITVEERGEVFLGPFDLGLVEVVLVERETDLETGACSVTSVIATRDAWRSSTPVSGSRTTVWSCWAMSAMLLAPPGRRQLLGPITGLGYR